MDESDAVLYKSPGYFMAGGPGRISISSENYIKYDLWGSFINFYFVWGNIHFLLGNAKLFTVMVFKKIPQKEK